MSWVTAVQGMFAGVEPGPKATVGGKVLLRLFCHAYGAKIVLLGRDSAVCRPNMLAQDI
jgi:hypothetical protein